MPRTKTWGRRRVGSAAQHQLLARSHVRATRPLRARLPMFIDSVRITLFESV